MWLGVSGVLLAGLVGALAWIVFASALLAVHDVEVIGQRRLTESAVLSAAEVPRGTPLVRVDLDEMRASAPVEEAAAAAAEEAAKAEQVEQAAAVD